jgi:hypothetical protein
MASLGSDTDSDSENPDSDIDAVEKFLRNALEGEGYNPLLTTLHGYRINEKEVAGELHQLVLKFLRGR